MSLKENKSKPDSIAEYCKKEGIANKFSHLEQSNSEKNKISKAPFNKIAIIIDVSGSTNNSDSGKRRGYDENENEPQKSTTDIIIFAELNGIAHHLTVLSKRFDLTGVELFIYSFSSNVYECHKSTIKSNNQLHVDVIMKLDEIILYECSGTEILKPFVELFKHIVPSDKIEIILATDGQATDQEAALNFLGGKNDFNFNMFVIGAGSIQESIGKQRVLYVKPGKKEGELLIKIDNIIIKNPPVRSKSTTSSECDKYYLEDLAMLGKKGTYVGAFGDYSILKLASDEYFDCITSESEVTFKVMLSDGKWGELPKNVIECLKVGDCCVSATQYGTYLVGKDFQVRVTPDPLFKVDFLVYPQKKDEQINSNLTELSYDYFANLDPKNLKYILVGPYKFIPEVDKSGYLRMRRILKFSD
jgi:hypothetical protein